MADREEVQDTDDYKVDKRGRKHKAHRIVFNKGEDDGKKGVSEQMKKTFSTFVEQHTPKLTEEQLNELVEELQEVLGKSASAGKWISDFVHSDNPKFAGKSKEKRKQMALAAYYSAQRNEELKGGQVKLDKNKNGKLDKQDFKLLRKEETELQEKYDHEKHNPFKHDTEEGPNDSDSHHIAHNKPAHVIHDHENEVEHHVHYHNGHTLITSSGHYQNSDTVKLKGKHSKAHIAGAIKHFNTHDESFQEYSELIEAYDPADYEATHEKSQFGGYRAKLVNRKTGKDSYLGGTAYKKPEHAKGEAETYRKHYSVGSGKVTPGANYRHDRAVSDYRKKAREAGHIHESAWDYKSKRAEGHKAGDVTSTKHEVSKSSSGGTIYKKQHDDQGMSKEFNRSGEAAQKRGRGRPKKNAFGEAVEFLMSLDETTFDSFMEEGFDAFMETYENLDEVSKATLGSYIKKASRDAVVKRKIGADFEHQADKSRKPGMKAAATQLADKYKAKSWSRSHNINKAVDRLSK